MARFKMKIEYDGTNYVGWQKQINGLSVQEVLETALTDLFQTPTQATASGRTDSGVHAKGQVVHFDATTTCPANKIPFALNTRLPNDISAIECEQVEDNFNARFSAKRKTYQYNLYCSQTRHPLLEKDHCRMVQKLDFDAMVEASKHIVGEHDFKCFEAAGSVVKSTVRTIYALNLEQSFLKDGTQIISMSVCGNGFLYNMVRILAGTLAYVGLHKLTSTDVENIIKNKDRTRAGKTLAPNGLCLVSVEYDNIVD